MSPALPIIPPDNPKRGLTLVEPDQLPHIGLVGDTYTITVTGEDTNGRFCVIDMHIPPGGGPPPHRHDFEETFILLEGEMEVTFRGRKSTVRTGDTVNIPANAPHQFHNVSARPVRALCICSPAGQEKFLLRRTLSESILPNLSESRPGSVPLQAHLKARTGSQESKARPA